MEVKVQITKTQFKKDWKKKTVKDIAEEYGIHPVTVRKYAVKIGLYEPVRKSRKRAFKF